MPCRLTDGCFQGHRLDAYNRPEAEVQVEESDRLLVGQSGLWSLSPLQSATDRLLPFVLMARQRLLAEVQRTRTHAT